MNNNRYIDLLVDFAFKKIFGTESDKALLIDLLNAVFESRKVIVDLVYNKNEHHGNNKEEAAAVFDLLCTGDKGEKFLIEVQHSKPINFKKRSIFYTSRLISEEAPKGGMKEWQYDISEVYFVAILDQPEPDHMPQRLISNGRYLHDVCLCYRDTGEIFYDQLGYTYIDLLNFVKTLEQCSTELDKWLYHLKNMQRMKHLPDNLEKTIFEQLYSAAEYVNLTQEEQRMYDDDLKRKWDNAAVLAGAEERGIEKGKAEEKLNIAQKMKAKGISIEDISEMSGLSQEEIEKL